MASPAAGAKVIDAVSMSAVPSASTQSILKRMMLAATVAAGLFVAAIITAPAAQANVDGSVPSPGACDYPGIGGFGAAFGEYDYACAFPTEINGSHWQTLFGGGMWSGTGGLSFMFVNFSITTPIGVLRGVTYWACPDLSTADPPNPIGAWKNEIHPSKCKTVGPKPELIPDNAPPPPPDVPQPPAAPPATGAVTDPGQGNPLATDNPH